MKTRVQKIILSAIIAGCVSMAAKADGTGSNNGYFWSLYHSGGSASISFGSGGNYKMTWSGVNDVTGGKGWNPGGSRTVGYNVGVRGGNVMGVYGWTTGPLIEYYIVEFGGNSSGTYVGSLSSDGHSYSVYKHQQVNQPSIQGTATFWQYLSEWGGSSTGSNHSVTTGNHFNYWKAHCGSMGSFNYMILLTEAWGGSSGSSNATVW
ncbi:MAG: glycoside hydrolase family 11 protein [Verrucomicrobiota bacterium]